MLCTMRRQIDTHIVRVRKYRKIATKNLQTWLGKLRKLDFYDAPLAIESQNRLLAVRSFILLFFS